MSDPSAAKIRVLSDDLANQIAAGEVVERPASVVKELVENSIDAGATRIEVEIESGGKKSIRIRDNGSGMGAEDAQLAFSRHSTSKIAKAQDLSGILTLGFRGEALPSIASVARVRLNTAADESEGGTQVMIEGGNVVSVKDAARSRGTDLEVAQLFYNTPARQKFLKGDGTEFSHIVQGVTQQALARPHIHFTLKHNGREILNTLPTDQLLYRIAELFGNEMAKELLEVKMEEGSYRLTGYVSSPIFTRSNRSAQYCFINGRCVRDKVILHATQQGYSHLLPKGRHPVIFLMLSMDAKLLDVNVHPSKAEVRFAYQQEVHRLVSEGVRRALSVKAGGDMAPPPEIPERENPAVAEPAAAYNVSASPAWRHGSRPFERESHTPEKREDLARALKMMAPSCTTAASPRPVPADECRQQPVFYDAAPQPVSRLIYSEYEPLGQLDRSFIVMQGKGGIVVVDQHVAHERILYERFRNAARDRKIEVQKLLFPQNVELSPAEAALLNTQRQRLLELGLDFEPFGDNAFVVRAMPAVLKDNDPEAILKEIAELLPRKDDPRVVEEKFEDILIMMSCRNAIKVNHTLNLEQIRNLIADLEQTEMPFTCPHGRPIALFFDINDILRKFLRK